MTLARKQQGVEQKHKDSSRGKQPDRQREMSLQKATEGKDLSGLPSPSRACQAITVMSATARLTSYICSIIACIGQREQGITGREGWGED